MDMRKMMKQAQKMQLELARAQEEIKDFTYTATAGGGMVSVTAKGDNTIESVVINPEAVDPEDVEMLQDMIVAAVNQGIADAQAMASQRMSAVTAGLSGMGLF